MTETTLRRLRRSVASLHRTGLLLPMAGITVMAGAAAVFPEAAAASTGFGMCDILQGDLGCGHGFGCACHLLPELPEPAAQI
jgi:hypothetical protein